MRPEAQADVDALREFLFTHHGSDFDAPDDVLLLAVASAQERVRQSGRRWSWKAIAAETIREGHEGPER